MRLTELKEMVKYIMLCNAMVLWGGTRDALADVPSWWTKKSMGFRRVWVITVMGYDRTVDSNLQNPGISLSSAWYLTRFGSDHGRTVKGCLISR